MVSCYHSDRHDPEFHVFLGCKNPFAFQPFNNTMQNLDTPITVVQVDYGFQQIAHETSADDSTSVACVSIGRSGGNAVAVIVRV